MTTQQAEFAKNQTQLPQSRGFASASGRPAIQPGRPTPTSWRMLVLPRPLPPPPPRRAIGGKHLRIDSPTSLSNGLGVPHFPLNWCEAFGWHDSVDALAALEADVAGDVAEVSGDGQPETKQDTPLAELVAQAAHDIRSPLVTAQQILDFVLERATKGQPLEDKDIELLNSANTRLKQADQWAEEILLERNLSVRGMVGVRRRFHPHQWRNSISPLLESIAEKHGITLRWIGWDRSLPRLYVDPNHLSRLVMNLVINAIEASSAGSFVTIRVAWQANVTRQLTLTIEDRGFGLDADLLQRLNSASHPAGSRMRDGKELGVGLRTAMALVNCIGAKLSAQCQGGGGTILRLSVPVDDRNLMIRHWLVRNVGMANNQRLSASLFEVRASHTDNMQVDRQLQLAAQSNNLVYRLANDRWAWLSLDINQSTSDERLASVARRLTQTGQQLSAEASCEYRLMHTENNIDLSNLHASDDPRQLLPYLSNAICYEIDALLDGKVPPVDEIMPENVDSALLKPCNQPRLIRVRHDVQGTLETRPSRLLEPAAVDKDEPAAAPLPSSDVIGDMAKQWRAIQAKLESLSLKQRDMPNAS